MEEEEFRQYEKMTCTPVWKLIMTLGLPTTVSMLITNIYNMADTILKDAKTIESIHGGMPVE